MKLTLCYVLVSTPDDYFAEMATVSMWTARHVMPECRVVLLMDPQTARSMSGVRAMCRDLADEPRVVPVGDTDDPMTRSRWIKTTMRQHVAGDFLYLDVDAVPVKDLSLLLNEPGPVAAALDGNTSASKFVFKDFERLTFERMNWPFPIRPYFNSGVMWIRDHPDAHALFKEWHRLWQLARRAAPPKDQPALNYANQRLGGVIRELPPQMNALFPAFLGGVKGARVLHYIGIRFEERDDTIFHRVVKHLRAEGQIDEEALVETTRTGYAWTDRRSLRYHWALGNYRTCAKIAWQRMRRDRDPEEDRDQRR